MKNEIKRNRHTTEQRQVQQQIRRMTLVRVKPSAKTYKRKTRTDKNG